MIATFCFYRKLEGQKFVIDLLFCYNNSRKIEREEIYMICCDWCKKEIEGGHYESSYTDILCEECGEDLLVWNYNLDSFVLEADDKEYYFDDELSDITTYRFVK
jgi:hypothetical protein